MPARTDLKTILILGSGPIQIGQAAEFDYSGTQALKALKGEGYRLILCNSNPATIQTDPELADATYLEPLTVEFIEKVIAKERPDALLPTLGGQTALNLAMELFETGVLERYNVELIGAGVTAIRKGEDRELFQAAMKKIGVETAQGRMIHTLEEAQELLRKLAFRRSFGPVSRWAEPAAVLLIRSRSSMKSLLVAFKIAPLTAHWSRNPSWVGKNLNSR